MNVSHKPDDLLFCAAELEVRSIKEEKDEKPNVFSSEWSCIRTGATSVSTLQEYPSPTAVMKTEKTEITSEEIIFGNTPDCTSALPEFHSKIIGRLPPHWIHVCDGFGASFLMLSRDVEMSTQRRVFVSFLGDVSVSVHRKRLNNIILLKFLSGIETMSLQHNVDNFVTYVIAVVNRIRKLEVCVGCNYEKYASLWTMTSLGALDTNPYGETRYSNTFRSHSCQLLILSSKWRCKKCYYLSEVFRKKLKSHHSVIKVNTPNVHLNEAEKMSKLSNLQKKLEVSRKLVGRLKQKLELQQSHHASASNDY